MAGESSCQPTEIVGLPPADKLQLLADVLALEFSQSLASAQCCAALRRLLPCLEYLSIAVRNPAGGGIVASANCAVEGPTTLHLHDPQSSAAGLALARGQPLQASLLNGTAAAVVSAWSDVQQIVGQAPGVTHLLCVPSGCVGGDDAAAAPEACQLHASSDGSGTGTLLFGFSAAPQLDARRKAALALLAQLLPAPMARLSADTLAFVNFATGSVAQCSCCCPHDSDGEEEEEDEQAAAGPCAPDKTFRGHDTEGAGPSQALAVSWAAAGEEGGSRAFDDSTGTDWAERHGRPPAAKVTATAVAATAEAHAAHLMQHPPVSVSPAGGLRFSKALLAAAEEEGEAITQQSPLTLAFRCPLMEGEYGRWVARQHKRGDTLLSLLLLSALAIVAYVQPYRLLQDFQLAVTLGSCALLLLYLSWFRPHACLSPREWLIAAFRLYTVALVHGIVIRTSQAHTHRDRMQPWLTVWRLTGAESLCVTAIGFRARMQLHLLLQLAALALASYNLTSMCSACYPDVPAGLCLKSSAALAALFGLVLPTAVLRYLEQRSRNLFASRLHSAAAHQQ